MASGVIPMSQSNTVNYGDGQVPKFGQQRGCYVWIRVQVPRDRSIVVGSLNVYEKVEGLEDDLTWIFSMWTMIFKRESKEGNVTSSEEIVFGKLLSKICGSLG